MDVAKIRKRIESAAVSSGSLPVAQAQKVAFHLTDWLDDMQALSQFCSAPDSLTDKEIDDLLTCFLLHVPEHVAAAAKLYVDAPISDVFGVGAVGSPSNEE